MTRFSPKRFPNSASNSRSPLIDVELSGPFRVFRRTTAQVDEPKKEVDLSLALPSIDDFRTSLLMTSLSARFSLLRENDDQNSNLGEANDDIAVYPNLQSRPADFNSLRDYQHDIAEIKWLRALLLGQWDSCQPDDAASIASSTICCPNPTGGNNQIGDRQKIYELGSGAQEDLFSPESYGGSIIQCIPQIWRQAGKERTSFETQQRQDTGQAKLTSGYSRRRETSSTTSFAPLPTRNLKSVTLIPSQTSSRDTTSAGRIPGLDRSAPRSQRLYKQDLSIPEYQSMAVSQMDTFSKQQVLDPSSAIQSSIVSAFGDWGHRLISSTTSKPDPPSFRPLTGDSFQVSSTNSTDKYPRQEQKPSFGVSPPVCPPINENKDRIAASIQSGGCGKTIANEVFSRLAILYEQSSGVQRQQELQEGCNMFVSGYPIEWTSSSAEEPLQSSLAHSVPAERTSPNFSVPEIRLRNEDNTRMGNNGRSSIDSRNATFIVAHCTVERPDNQDHPVLRQSALLTPLYPYTLEETDKEDSLLPSTRPDSPTLGHSAGLFGVVRRHLRHDSTASSVYSCRTETSSNNSSEEHDIGPAEDVTTDERDEFAQHLSDCARRVREKLATYVEELHSHPVRTIERIGLSKSNSFKRLGLKSSRAFLFPKHEKEQSRLKAIKLPRSQPKTAGTSPSQEYPSSRNELQVGEIAAAHASKPAPAQPEGVPVGSKACRQASLELQQTKEVEVQRRHTQQLRPIRKRLLNGRVTSNAKELPLASGSLLPTANQGYGKRPEVGSRAVSQRYKRGAETSENGCAYIHDPRLGNATKEYDKENQDLKIKQHIKLRPLQELRQVPVRSSKDLFMAGQCGLKLYT